MSQTPILECRFINHDWQVSNYRVPGGGSTWTSSCTRCGVGHSVFANQTAPLEIETRLTVFPAKGTGMVSRKILAWSLKEWEEVNEKMERDGLRVVRGKPEVTGRLYGEAVDEEVEEWALKVAQDVASLVEENIVQPLNAFLRAATSEEASHLLRQNPQLMSAQVARIIDKALNEAQQRGDAKQVRHLQERRRLIETRRGTDPR